MLAPNPEPVNITYMYHFSPHIVFDAWVRPEIISKWLFVGPTSEIIHIEINAVTGGRFSILELERSNGLHIDHFGEYKKVDNPRNLVFHFQYPNILRAKRWSILKSRPCRVDAVSG